MNTLSVCPVEDIGAPLDGVSSLLVDPGKLDLWWDAKLQRAPSVGTMVPGQLIDAAPQGFFKKFHIGLAVKDVNHAQHRLSLVASLPANGGSPQMRQKAERSKVDEVFCSHSECVRISSVSDLAEPCPSRS